VRISCRVGASTIVHWTCFRYITMECRLHYCIAFNLFVVLLMPYKLSVQRKIKSQSPFLTKKINKHKEVTYHTLNIKYTN